MGLVLNDLDWQELPQQPLGSVDLVWHDKENRLILEIRVAVDDGANEPEDRAWKPVENMDLYYIQCKKIYITKMFFVDCPSFRHTFWHAKITLLYQLHNGSA